MATGRIVSPAKFLGKVAGGIMNVVQGNKAGKAGESTASDKRRGSDESSSGSEEDEDFVGSLP